MAVFFCFVFFNEAYAQQKTDSIAGFGNITLSEVVVSNKLNIPAFIERIRNDSSF